jgi:aromatic-L-amino-acid/L-tryptophan decarboxylase
MRERPGDAALAIESERFRALGHELVDAVADFMGGQHARPVVPADGPAEIRALLDADAPLPETGEDPATLLASTARLLFDHSTLNAHPRFFGYITASPAPIGVLGDFLAAAVNPNCGGWILSPAAAEIEGQTVRWIAELIGYPSDCGGVLVSGGNVANFTCFLAARAAAASWEVREDGLSCGAARRLAVYVSAETHTWISKAADVFGLGTAAIRWIPTDAELRMEPAALERAITADLAAGVQPLLVVGTAGTVSTGAVDPLEEIAAVCRAHRVWFHVDGAYGGFAAAAADVPAPLRSLALADSIAVDPHKWLYAPLEAGCALVRDAAALRGAFSYRPPYYHFGVEATNYVDYGLQNSRGFRALKVWLALRQAGRSGYARMIGDDIALSRRLFRAVGAHPELEPATQALSIATFRYVPPDLRARVGGDAVEEYLNRLNQELLDRLQKAGEAFVSNAVIRGRYVLRACIVNFNTAAPDVDALPEIVAAMGRRVDQELRAAPRPVSP